MTAASARAQAPRGRFLSPARLAMVSLVSGAILVGGSGASLAVSGLSSDGSAGIAQYVQNTTTGTTPDTGAVAASEDQGGDGCSTTSGAQSSQTNCPDDSDTTPSLTPDQGDVAPAADTGGDDAQETKQVASGGSDGRLPFTGLAALPLLLIGVVMLSGGFLLRLRPGRATPPSASAVAAAGRATPSAAPGGPFRDPGTPGWRRGCVAPGG